MSTVATHAPGVGNTRDQPDLCYPPLSKQKRADGDFHQTHEFYVATGVYGVVLPSLSRRPDLRNHTDVITGCEVTLQR
jgi:hypothetical protein